MNKRNPSPSRPYLFGLVLTLTVAPLAARDIDLTSLCDEQSPLKNPHKGWYHHFPDNHINKYVIARDTDLLEFPGMDHLYIRLAWAYLQPEEGRFNWAIIDDLITKWTNHGLGIAFRISCKETSTDRIEQQFATPRWVKEAGARGGFYRLGKDAGPDAPWEPEFDDSVFLEKLDLFLGTFAARYDGQPWLYYVDIGSLGDWGEGHTWAGSRKQYNFEQRKRHVDLHLKHFRKSQLVISDDFVHDTGGPEERQRMHKYVMEHGISYRDDSILVDGYFGGHSATYTVRSPEFFQDTWQRLPTILELEHYSAVKKSGNWVPSPNSSLARYGEGKTGEEMLRGALGLLHATYIGYHGYAAEWLKDNPSLTVALLNRCGYWYFLRNLQVPTRFVPGKSNPVQMTWENRGVAPAYVPFRLVVRLEGTSTIEVAQEARNCKWLPEPQGKTWTETYDIKLPNTIQPGSYRLAVKLHSPQVRRDVFLALKPALLDSSNFYRIGEVTVEP